MCTRGRVRSPEKKSHRAITPACSDPKNHFRPTFDPYKTTVSARRRIAFQIMLPPQVSIIITSYNQQEYLREAIESAIDQTAAAFEIIVADDHSTKDGSAETIRKYAAKHPGLVRGIFQ